MMLLHPHYPLSTMTRLMNVRELILTIRSWFTLLLTSSPDMVIVDTEIIANTPVGFDEPFHT